MNSPTLHYLLMCEANREGGLGHWRFVLRTEDDSVRFEAADVEPDIWGERLNLLTVVRAMESLDQPSRVTLIGCSRYVEQGVQFGLVEWRENGWQWEAFGQMVSVRDADLWQRMDRVLQFHQIDCCQRRTDGGHAPLAGPHWDLAKEKPVSSDRVDNDNWIKYSVPIWACLGGLWMSIASRCWHQMAGLGTSILLHRS